MAKIILFLANQIADVLNVSDNNYQQLKKGGVCIYYQEHIPLILWDDINTLENCLVTEIRSQNEKCFLTCIYRSPSQNQDGFKNFLY